MLKETKVWLNLADEHFKDADLLFKHRHFSGCVYFCHQTLEKILKACIVEFVRKIPPKHHDLDRLAEATKIDFLKKYHKQLKLLTRDFWNVRYADFRKYKYDIKTKVEPIFVLTKEVYLCLKKKLSTT